MWAIAPLWHNLALAGAIIVGVAAVLGALATIWRKLIRPSIDLVDMVGDLKGMMPALETITKELVPNGGASLVDRVKKLDERTERIDHATGSLIDSVTEGQVRDEKLAETLAHHTTKLDHLEGHATQFTEFEKYQRGRNHWLGSALQRIFLAFHIQGVEMPAEDDPRLELMPAADPPFPGDDSDLVPDKFPLNRETREGD